MERDYRGRGAIVPKRLAPISDNLKAEGPPVGCRGRPGSAQLLGISFSV